MTSTMAAVAASGGALHDTRVPVPELRPHDILVRVEAVSVNPVDTKQRKSLASSSEPVILGYDAAGVVEAVGPQVTTHAVGDDVWYAGDISRPGSNAQFQAVDERIVGRKPKSLSYNDSAALPLTAITAWETLFERFSLARASRGDLLVLGAACGVGSIMIQLAKALSEVRVIATASRAESREWATQMGADAVISHHDLQAQALGVAPDGVDYLFSPHSQGNVEIYAEIVRPFGHITAIDEPPGLDLLPLKAKSIAWHWELMFTRSLSGYDLIGQQNLLNEVAAMVDAATLRSTVTAVIDDFSATGIQEAHRQVESGRMVGKVVVTRA
ncbi:zinc-binding alcohol dehydrogenase family protein [soil metagenome]